MYGIPLDEDAELYTATNKVVLVCDLGGIGVNSNIFTESVRFTAPKNGAGILSFTLSGDPTYSYVSYASIRKNTVEVAQYSTGGSVSYDFVLNFSSGDLIQIFIRSIQSAGVATLSNCKLWSGNYLSAPFGRGTVNGF